MHIYANEEIKVLKSLVDKHYFKSATIIEYAEDFFNFGNAYSIWQYGNLNLRFIKDRAQTFVDIGSKYDKGEYFTFDVLSVYMGWQTIDELLISKTSLEIDIEIKCIKRYND